MSAWCVASVVRYSLSTRSLALPRRYFVFTIYVFRWTLLGTALNWW